MRLIYHIYKKYYKSILNNIRPTRWPKDCCFFFISFYVENMKPNFLLYLAYLRALYLSPNDKYKHEIIINTVLTVAFSLLQVYIYRQIIKEVNKLQRALGMLSKIHTIATNFKEKYRLKQKIMFV